MHAKLNKGAIGLASALFVALAAGQTPKATPVPLIHPEWGGIWKAAPGDNDDQFMPFETAAASHSGPPIEHPPLKPEFLKAYRDRLARMKADLPVTDPAVADCQPLGLPRMMLTNHPFRLSMLPDRVNWYSPWGIQTRWIFLDGRLHPSPDEIDLAYRGESIGQWQGDTLVIDSKGFTPKTLVDGTGVPHGETMHIIERVRMIRPDELEWKISVQDPEHFTRAWNTTKHYVRAPEADLGDEYICSATKSTGHF